MSAHGRWAVLLPCLNSGSGVPQSIPWVGPGGALSVAGCHRAAVGLTLRSLACPLEVSPEQPTISRAPSWGPVQGHVCRLSLPSGRAWVHAAIEQGGDKHLLGWGHGPPLSSTAPRPRKTSAFVAGGGHPASLAARV